MKKLPGPLTTLLFAAWDAGCDTWSGTPRLVGDWTWFNALANITNVRINGFRVPSPWGQTGDGYSEDRRELSRFIRSSLRKLRTAPLSEWIDSTIEHLEKWREFLNNKNDT